MDLICTWAAIFGERMKRDIRQDIPRIFSESQEERSTRQLGMRGKMSRPKEEKRLETNSVPHIREGCPQKWDLRNV